MPWVSYALIILDFFLRGVDLARRQGGMEGATLEAQVEIAWGESQVVLSQFLGRVLEQLRPRLVALELKYEAEALTARESQSCSTCARPSTSMAALLSHSF